MLTEQSPASTSKYFFTVKRDFKSETFKIIKIYIYICEKRTKVFVLELFQVLLFAINSRFDKLVSLAFRSEEMRIYSEIFKQVVFIKSCIMRGYLVVTEH